MAGAGCSCGALAAGAAAGVAASDMEEDVATSPAVSTASDADIVLSTTVECALAAVSKLIVNLITFYILV